MPYELNTLWSQITLSESAFITMFAIGAGAVVAALWIMRPRASNVVNQNKTTIRRSTPHSGSDSDGGIKLFPGGDSSEEEDGDRDGDSGVA